jgi:hypothetical protein
LLLQVNVLVKSVIVEFRVIHFFFHGSLAVGLVENVKDLDGVHDDVLLENVFDDHDRDVRLEFKDSRVEVLLWDTMGQKLS